MQQACAHLVITLGIVPGSLPGRMDRSSTYLPCVSMAKKDPYYTWGILMRAPFIRSALPFACGIAFAFWHPIELDVAGWSIVVVSTAALLALFLPTLRAPRWRRGAVAMLWFFVFGSSWQVLRDPLTHPDHAQAEGSEEEVRILRITTVNGISKKVLRADADVLAVVKQDTVLPRLGKVMLTLMRGTSEDPKAGDELIVKGRLEAITRIPDPGGFDRRAWAGSRGMYHECFAGIDAWWKIGHGWQWTDLFEGTRQRISRWLEASGLPFRERALVKALVLGLRDELDGEQKDAFVRSGTIHVLAVSGTHVGFIYAMLLFMLGWWGGRRHARIARGVLVLLALWGYAGLTGACPSVLRATIMFSLFTLAGMADRRAEPLNSLFAAAFLLLLWDPHMLVEIGFQLSFLAVLGILLFHAPIERLWIPNNKWIGHLWTLTVMSISAQLLTTPLSLYLFQAFPIWFLPANLVVVTVAGFAVYASVALLALHRLPFLGPVVVFVLTLLLTIVDRVTRFFADLPGAYPAVRIGAVDMLLIYALVVLVAIGIMWRWRPSRPIALVTAALLLISWGYRAGAAHERVTFTIYDDRKALQAAITVGRSMTVLAAVDSALGDAWVQKKIERHQRAMGQETVHFASFDVVKEPATQVVGSSIVGGGLLCASGLLVRTFCKEDPIHASPEGVDVLVFHDIRYLPDSTLGLVADRAAHVVVTGQVSWGARERIRTWCEKRAVPFHDVKSMGAFIFHVPARDTRRSSLNG